AHGVLDRGVRALDAASDSALFSLLRPAGVRRLAVAVHDRHSRARLALRLLYGGGVSRGHRSDSCGAMGGGARAQLVRVVDMAANHPAASGAADAADARQLSHRNV